jgi:hypothetical protein
MQNNIAVCFLRVLNMDNGQVRTVIPETVQSADLKGSGHL